MSRKQPVGRAFGDPVHLDKKKGRNMRNRSGAVTADAVTIDGPKERNCLRCRAVFPSEWIGERICRRCKDSQIWRSGLPANFSVVR